MLGPAFLACTDRAHLGERRSMGEKPLPQVNRGQWMALTAALLGWMFDGLEMGLFPLVAGPALQDLLQTKDDGLVGQWYGVITAGFLIGAATGGVLFGWLGDRIGRVRAMTLSVLAYALFSGLCGVTTAAWQIAVLRFLAALGMGGEWSLGVALVMEIWPDRSRAFLAGLIGAAANVGYLLIALLSLVLNFIVKDLEAFLRGLSLSEDLVHALVANSGWRLLMLCGAAPALLTFLIRLFVPESERWVEEKSRGSTSHWVTQDLLGVVIGAAAACVLIPLWAVTDLPLAVRIVGSVPALIVATLGYLYPVRRYLHRASADGPSNLSRRTLTRMLLAAGLAGIALLGTWASIQQVPTWVFKKLPGGTEAGAKEYTQFTSAAGAIVGTFVAALLGGWLGRRVTYCLLCVASLASALALFQLNSRFDAQFLILMFLAGFTTASFYGWLPLYLPELFPTKVRATGQGFSFNFGRIIAAVGALQGGYLINTVFKGDFPAVCSIMSCVYLLGLGLIWLLPETHGQPLPE
jgi:MFS family permease